MTHLRYTRRRDRTAYSSASRDDFAIWAHVAYVILVSLAVLGATVIFGFWVPS